MANHGDDVTMPARLGTQNAKTILGVVVRYSLDETRQHFLGRRFRLRTHADYPVSLSAIKFSFGMLGGKRLFPKLSDPPRVKSHLVWQEKRRRSAVLEFRRGRASDIDSYTACPTQFLRHALSVVHKSPRSQPRSQPRHNSSRSMAGGVVFFSRPGHPPGAAAPRFCNLLHIPPSVAGRTVCR